MCQVGEYMKKDRDIMVPGVCVLLVLLIISISGWTYYNYTIREYQLEDANDIRAYERHYVLIVENTDSLFWQSVYASAVERAAEKDAYLELMGTTISQGYTMEDMMRMSIAESVDGILLEYTGGDELVRLIDEAVGKNIPVVTISEDAPQSQRQSFVGVNTYQLGEAYSQQVISLIDDTTENVMILTKNSSDESNQKLISVQISNAVAQYTKGTQKVDVEVKNVDSQSAFDSEEVIRNIFSSRKGPPDILVCMDEVDTECAYQAVIDYNEVGAVSIVGYYATPTVLEGIQKKIIPVIVELDADQMGRNGIQALTEYRKEGRVSDYFSVDVNLITCQNVEEYISHNEEKSK